MVQVKKEKKKKRKDQIEFSNYLIDTFANFTNDRGCINVGLNLLSSEF